jgi:hypothetical protein
MRGSNMREACAPRAAGSVIEVLVRVDGGSSCLRGCPSAAQTWRSGRRLDWVALSGIHCAAAGPIHGASRTVVMPLPFW